jgi:hypothetical protein
MYRLASVLVLLLGCKGGTTDVELVDPMNYSFHSEITAQSQVIQERVDTTVDWCGLTTSLLGDPVDPMTGITDVSIVRFPNLSQDEVLAGINDNTLKQSDLDAFAGFVPSGGCTANLTDFDLFGTHVNPDTDITAAGGTYLVTADVVDTNGKKTFLMLGFFEPSAGEFEEPPPVLLTSDSAELTFDVDLEAGDPIVVPDGATKVHIDWAGLTQNGSDQEIELSSIDTLVVAHFSASIADLEADFLNIDTLADEQFTGDVGGFGDANLDLVLEDESGAAFTGFTTDGTWILSLQCSLCINPAPPFLAVVSVE